MMLIFFDDVNDDMVVVGSRVAHRQASYCPKIV
jgi:hypothetical protein